MRQADLHIRDRALIDMGWLFSRSGEAKKTRVLVVDDDALTADVCVRLLEQLGYEAEAVTHPSAALDALGRQMREIVLTDLIMKEMDGKGLLREIKRRYPMTDVILMSAYPNIVDVIVAMKLGAYDFLIKPVTGDMLELTMKRCLEKRALALEKNVEHSLRRRVESHMDRLKEIERDREAMVKDHGTPLFTALRKLESVSKPLADEISGHVKAILGALAKKITP